MQDLFIPSVHDAGPVMTQAAAIHFIAHLTKTKTNTNALHILTDYFLPHIGETNYIEKAYFLGYMVKRLLMTHQGMELPIDRDSFRYKRVELVGALMYKLFREYYKMQMKHIHVSFEKKLYYNLQIYENDLHGLINTNYKTVFGERIVEEGFRKAFKGNWGATEHTKIIGVVQDLNRLSFNSALSHLRKTNLAVKAGAKLIGPRILNGSQWGLVDPIDTPDGGNIGLHKQLCIMTQVSRGVSREPMVKWLKEKCELRSVEECGIISLAKMTKVMVNGYWAGVTTNPQEIVEKAETPVSLDERTFEGEKDRRPKGTREGVDCRILVVGKKLQEFGFSETASRRPEKPERFADQIGPIFVEFLKTFQNEDEQLDRTRAGEDAVDEFFQSLVTTPDPQFV
jgi:DNA-directed RNA polymerase II subunit RPB2